MIGCLFYLVAHSKLIFVSKKTHQAITDATNQILLNDCLSAYVDAMENWMNTNQNQLDFMEAHQKNKNAAILQVQTI